MRAGWRMLRQDGGRLLAPVVLATALLLLLFTSAAMQRLNVLETRQQVEAVRAAAAVAVLSQNSDRPADLAEQPGQKRRAREERAWQLFSFLTTDANDIVRPVHEKAMPTILFDPTEQKEWLGGGETSLRLQRPLPNRNLEIRQ